MPDHRRLIHCREPEYDRKAWLTLPVEGAIFMYGKKKFAEN
jgi:hypothetical protein